MTIDELIHDKIRQRFDLPADWGVEFVITPFMTLDDGYNDEATYCITVGFGGPEEIVYDSWDDFVTDMEVKVKPEPPTSRGIRNRPEVSND